jgi:hypothetical protein
MKTIIFTLAILALASTGVAIPGDTLNQCKAKYGEPIMLDKSWDEWRRPAGEPDAEPGVAFKSGRWYIFVHFYKGRSATEFFVPIDRKPIEMWSPNPEIDKILRDNAGAFPWKLYPTGLNVTVYVRMDGEGGGVELLVGSRRLMLSDPLAAPRHGKALAIEQYLKNLKP